MKCRLGRILETWRGDTPRTELAEILGLSYTFVRSMERGQRFPSDPELKKIARKLGLSADDLIIAAYCDRSPLLASALQRREKKKVRSRARAS